MKRGTPKLSKQMKAHVAQTRPERPEYDGDIGTVISTGSTLLDLAITGERVRGGGLPGGILVEARGPEGAGKTVLLCEIGGGVQRQDGEVMFCDPEARLNDQFARMFDLDTEKMSYATPDTVKEMFKALNEWEPEPEDKIHGIFTDSLAALSTEMEMESEDKRGQLRAKDFSQGFRKYCRVIKQKNLLMVCSNQLRDVMDAGPYGPKTESPGGRAIRHHSSLRLQFFSPQKKKDKKKVKGKDVERVIGVETMVYVSKSTVGKPYREAPVFILFDYGIDNIRTNLQFIKKNTGSKLYTLGNANLAQSMNESIGIVEREGMESKLRDEVINLWESIEAKFQSARRPKRR